MLDNAAFERFARDERETPPPRKGLSDRTIFVSRLMPFIKGFPKSCDLSEARFSGPQNTDLVMSDEYRSPEVALGMPRSYSVDLWGFAMTASLTTPQSTGSDIDGA